MAQEPNDVYDVNKWLYVPPFYAEYRYVLGTKGGSQQEVSTNPYSLIPNPLIVIGVNPSTAAPDALDPTLRSAERIAYFNGYDSFWMLNVYAQRATDPDEMERESNAFLQKQNILAFEKLLSLSPTKDVWCAWGNVIEKRQFLKNCVSDFIITGNKFAANWLQAEKTCKSGNPHHPLYLKSDTKLIPFEP